MTDERLQQICEEVEASYHCGGLSNGLYGDFAKDVAKRAMEEEQQEARLRPSYGVA